MKTQKGLLIELVEVVVVMRVVVVVVMMVVIEVMVVEIGNWCGSDSCSSGHSSFGFNGGHFGYGEFINLTWIIIFLMV